MSRLIITGGRPLAGTVRLRGAKNSSFKLMIAALLAEGKTRITNLSAISEVDHVAEMIRALGGKAEIINGREAIIDSRGISRLTIPDHLGKNSRASTLFLGPLLARFKQASVPLPGGDAIGKRPLDRHISALSELGARIVSDQNCLRATAPELIGSVCRLEKNSHTATETLIMAAVLARGQTVIENAAQEPEVDDLIGMLKQMGAKISREKRRIVIDGAARLRATDYAVMPDRNQAVSYAAAALATGGEVVVQNARAGHLRAFINKVKAAGGGVEIGRQGIRFFTCRKLRATDIVTRPHPGFMTDWQPLWSVLMTQAEGKTKIIEAVFLNRFQFVPDLISMGAQIRFFDPKPPVPDNFYNFNLTDDRPDYRHGIIISGPCRLGGGKFEVKDIRNGATLAIAGLAASGQTVLSQAELMDRGYHNFTEHLAGLGANIKRKL